MAQEALGIWTLVFHIALGFTLVEARTVGPGCVGEAVVPRGVVPLHGPPLVIVLPLTALSQFLTVV
jgi:hypothetical protein